MIINVTASGRLTCGGRAFRCALGRSGIVPDKREGDGGTPVGRFPLRRVLFRPDRLAQPATTLPVEPIEPDMGWCDDPAHVDYNRQVRLPFPASHERLWREDEVYDVIVILGHNDDPPVPGGGSAIFMHVARTDYSPTEGCVALSREDLLALLSECGNDAEIEITLPDMAAESRK